MEILQPVSRPEEDRINPTPEECYRLWKAHKFSLLSQPINFLTSFALVPHSLHQSIQFSHFHSCSFSLFHLYITSAFFVFPVALHHFALLSFVSFCFMLPFAS